MSDKPRKKRETNLTPVIFTDIKLKIAEHYGKMLRGKRINYADIGEMTGYSESTVGKVATCDTFEEFREKYKQPGGAEYRRRNVEKEDLLPFTDPLTEEEAQAAAEAECPEDPEERARRQLVKDLGAVKKAADRQIAEAEQIDMETWLHDQHEKNVDDFMRLATVQLSAQTVILDRIRELLEQIAKGLSHGEEHHAEG